MGEVDPFAPLLDPDLMYCPMHDILYTVGSKHWWQKKIARQMIRYYQGL